MSELDDYFKKGTGSKIPARGQQFSGVMSREEQKIAGQAKTNNNFERGLVSKARKGDMQAVALLGAIQNGRVDVSGPTGVRAANPRQDLNVGQNRVDQINQGMWADQGAGEIPEPGQAPKAAEPQRQVGPNASMGAGYGKPLQGANGARPTNPGTKADRAEVGNAPTLAEQQEAIDNPSLAPSAPVGDTTPAAAPGASKNGKPEASFESRRGVGKNGRPETDFEIMDREARERVDAEDGWGKPKTNFAKKAWEGFKSDLEKSNLIKTGRDYEAGKAPEEVRAAQAKALERGLSLGGNREQLQEMIGMETDSDAKTRKSQEYQDKFGDSDEKYKALLERTLTEKDKAAGVADKMFKALSPEDRLDSISKLAKGPSEKTKALLLEAKQKAAARTGYTGEVTADTDFGKEAKAAIPGAKNAMQSLIDAGDLVPGSESNPSLQKSIQELKERRGSAMFGQTQMDIVNQAPSITSEKGENVDPLSTGNPLFDNPNADSVAWANSNNTSSKPTQKSSGTPTKELSASFQDQPFTSPDPIKPWLMGDSGKSNKPPEKAWYDKKASEVFQAPDFLEGTIIGGIIDSIGEFSKPDIKKMAEKGQPSRLEKLQYEGSEIDDIGRIIKKGKTATPEERKQVYDANRKTLEERKLPEETSKVVKKLFSTKQKIQAHEQYLKDAESSKKTRSALADHSSNLDKHLAQ